MLNKSMKKKPQPWPPSDGSLTESSPVVPSRYELSEMSDSEIALELGSAPLGNVSRMKMLRKIVNGCDALKPRRVLGCSGVEWMGRKSVTPETLEQVAESQIGTPLSEYCSRDWLDAVDPHTFQRLHNDSPEACAAIPFPEYSGTPACKQWVLGRMANLKPYYACSSKFIALDTDDWDRLYKVNDAFMACAVRQKHDTCVFPIRIVLDRKCGISSYHPKTGLRFYGGLSPHIENRYKKIPVLSREICQLVHVFGFHVYRSSRPHILFARREPLTPRKTRAMNMTPVEFV